MKYKETLQKGIRRSSDHGITLSVFKEVVKPFIDEHYIEDCEFYETCGIEEEDFWTFRFESWCLQMMGWVETYPINRETLLSWAKEEYQKTGI
jgi:hypothetical protein